MKELLSRIAAFVSWHRRAVGALLAALTVLAVAQWVSAPDGPTAPVMVAAAAVPAGSKLSEGDVTVARLPEAAVPDGALRTAEDVVGRLAAVPLAPGTALHPNLFATARDVADGAAIVPVRLPDAGLRSLLTPGDRVSLIVAVAEDAQVLTSEARVAGIPSDKPATGLGLSSPETDLILVEVPEAEAPVVAALGQSGQLSVVLRGG